MALRLLLSNLPTFTDSDHTWDVSIADASRFFIPDTRFSLIFSRACDMMKRIVEVMRSLHCPQKDYIYIQEDRSWITQQNR